MVWSAIKRIPTGDWLSVEMSRQEKDRNYNNQTGFRKLSQRCSGSTTVCSNFVLIPQGNCGIRKRRRGGVFLPSSINNTIALPDSAATTPPIFSHIQWTRLFITMRCDSYSLKQFSPRNFSLFYFTLIY